MREVWLQAHLKQPLGSRDGSRTRQRGGSGLKSTTGGSRGAAPLPGMDPCSQNDAKLSVRRNRPTAFSGKTSCLMG